MTEIREDMLKVKRMISDVEIILGKREGETELVNQLIDAQNLLTYCMSRLENAIVPPCKVGDTVYKVSFVHKTVIPLKVEGFICNLAGCWKVHCTHLVPSWVGNKKEHFYYSFSSFGKTVFLTSKEAENALAERSVESA